MLVFFSFMPIGAIPGGLTGAILLALLTRSRPDTKADAAAVDPDNA
jgi:hypothetical protein